MEVPGGGGHEQSFLVPRFERAKRGREGGFSTVTFNSDNAICFYSHTIRYISTHPNTLPTIPPEHHHLLPSSLQVQAPPVRSQGKNLKGDLKRPTKLHQERERREGEEK